MLALVIEYYGVAVALMPPPFRWKEKERKEEKKNLQRINYVLSHMRYCYMYMVMGRKFPRVMPEGSRSRATFL